MEQQTKLTRNSISYSIGRRDLNMLGIMQQVLAACNILYVLHGSPVSEICNELHFIPKALCRHVLQIV